ncbi:MAG: NAD-dependent epimerase/dehydratase family protein [Alphaproteobacteria bacterium]|nr:NAD-dependent epimerase/dehydratase family protein [Alphaproteobacteria bacterium]
MTDRVLLTGISGFLGGHVAVELLRAGFRVRGSVRSAAKADKVRAALAAAGADLSRIELVTLDLKSDDGWPAAMADTRYVVHTASPFVLGQPRDRMDLIRPAVDGTDRAVRAALATEVERVVLTSSTVAVAYGHPPGRAAVYTDKDWTDLSGKGVTAYFESKTRAERRAWELMDAAGRRQDLAVINPGGILGPLLDDDPGTSAMIVLLLLNGRMPAMPRAPMALIDVRDVAAAHVAALAAPEAGGRRYLMVERLTTLADLAEVLRQAFPERARSIPRRQIPDWLLRGIGIFNADMRNLAEEAGNPRRYDSAPVAALLKRDLIPVPVSAVETARSLIGTSAV